MVPVPVIVVPPGFRVKVHVPVAGNPEKVTLPVGRSHVGWMMAPTTGAGGDKGTVFITLFADDTHVGLSILRTLIVYVAFAAKPLNVFEFCHIVPLSLYCKLLPNGEAICIVPLLTIHVGCVTIV